MELISEHTLFYQSGCRSTKLHFFYKNKYYKCIELDMYQVKIEGVQHPPVTEWFRLVHPQKKPVCKSQTAFAQLSRPSSAAACPSWKDPCCSRGPILPSRRGRRQPSFRQPSSKKRQIPNRRKRTPKKLQGLSKPKLLSEYPNAEPPSSTYRRKKKGFFFGSNKQNKYLGPQYWWANFVLPFPKREEI